MKKARVKKGEKCPMCGVVLKDGDEVRLVEATIIKPGKKSVTAKVYCHAKCWEKFPHTMSLSSSKAPDRPKQKKKNK